MAVKLGITFKLLGKILWSSLENVGTARMYSPPVVDELDGVVGVAEAEAPLHFHPKFA